MADLPEGLLMQRAATGLATRIATMLRETGGVYGSHVTLLVGPGDNGGDALFAGAQLARRGARVTAIEIFPGKAHPEGMKEFSESGGRVSEEMPRRNDLVVDGIFGIGGRPGLPPRAAQLLSHVPLVPTVAVDAPSGIEMDTGGVLSQTVQADVTVTFGCLKPGIVVGAGAAQSGLVECIDIGLGPYLPERPYARIPDLDDIVSWWPKPRPHDDKYTRGVLGVCAGSYRYPGAGELAVAGALAGPAGYIRYAGTASRHIRYSYSEVVTKDRVADAGTVTAWVAGPGMGTDLSAESQLESAMAEPVPMCLDADALTLVADDHSILEYRQAPSVVTPHDREYSRLAGRAPGHDRITDALDLAIRLGCVVLLKGYRTVIASPTGNVFLNPTGDPALATAGSGDVLAGLLGAMLAAGVPTERAAVAAAFVHGLAGKAAAERGPVTAMGVANELPKVIGRLISSVG